jgi:hypothetical protein
MLGLCRFDTVADSVKERERALLRAVRRHPQAKAVLFW